MVNDMENLKDNVQSKFAEIRNALHMREKLLLRQADVILQQVKQQQLGCGNSYHSPAPTSAVESREVKFLAEMEIELLNTIRNFGRFQLDNINLTLQDVYLRNEDYISPANDHETMYKCLQQAKVHLKDEVNMELKNRNEEDEDGHPEAIVVDFSCNKSLIEHNAKHMNKSIINITLQEAKELIKKAKIRREMPIPPLNLEELDDELESSIAEAVSSLGHDHKSHNNTQTSNEETNTTTTTTTKTSKSSKKSSANRFKPKITINNCNGTINLRNISNLTINCASEDSITAQIPCQQHSEQDEDVDVDIDVNGDVNEFISNSQNHNKKIASGSSNTNTSQRNATVIEAIMSSTDDSPLTPTTTASSSNYSSTSSSRSQSKKLQKTSSLNKKSQSGSIQGRPRTYGGIIDYDDDDDDRDNIESHAVTCDFYNRLLKEIKNSLRTKRTNINHNENVQTQQFTNDQSQTNNENENENENEKDDENLKAINSSGDYSKTRQEDMPEKSLNEPNANVSFSTTATNTSNATKHSGVNPSPGICAGAAASGRRLILKNFENLRIVLEANSSDEESFHPVQIEQWLAEIISETDLEPMQNTDILEHSKIHNETLAK